MNSLGIFSVIILFKVCRHVYELHSSNVFKHVMCLRCHCFEIMKTQTVLMFSHKAGCSIVKIDCMTKMFLTFSLATLISVLIKQVYKNVILHPLVLCLVVLQYSWHSGLLLLTFLHSAALFPTLKLFVRRFSERKCDYELPRHALFCVVQLLKFLTQF